MYAQESTTGKYSLEFSVTPISTVTIGPFQELVGAGSNESDRYFGGQLGIGYQYNSWLSLHTSIAYSRQNVTTTPAVVDPTLHRDIFHSKINIIELPLEARVKFLKYLYANVGPSIHLQQNTNKYVDKQSGVGMTLGIGAAVPVSKYMKVTVAPHYKIYSLIPFEAGHNRDRIQLLGGTLGVGYNFAKARN